MKAAQILGATILKWDGKQLYTILQHCNLNGYNLWNMMYELKSAMFVTYAE
jgi:hypothetical protein